MQFFEYLTNYDYWRRHPNRKTDPKEYRSLHKADPIDFYNKVLDSRQFEAHFGHPARGNIREGNARASLIAERDWLSSGKPYYKIYPKMAEMMAGISIDIPVETLEFPYPAFAIYFADSEENTLRDPNGPRLKSILMFRMNVEQGRDDTSFKFKAYDKLSLASGAVRAVYLNYAFEGDFRGEPYLFNYTLSLRKEVRTIEDFFQKSWETSMSEIDCSPGEYMPSQEMVRKVLNIAIATCFFGIDQHEVVLPDLGRKKLERKFRNFPNQSDAIRDLKDQRKHTKKWTIGREISLPLPITEERKGAVEGRRELSHGYLRRGHMRWQSYGEKRSMRRLIFIHPHPVRPDLPMATAHGYRISDSNVQKGN